jgi:hypothetical protein
MSQNLLVSFIVVTHDRSPELVASRTIASIAAQDHGRCELVLMGEQCAHLAALAACICERFPALHCRATNLARPASGFASPAERVARCRNAGVALAEGDFISCQDDDNALSPAFASTLLTTLLTTGADAAWCHRRMIMPDGSPYPGTFFPWAMPGTLRERLIYDIWRSAGVLAPGSDVVKDQLLAANYSEVFSTVDANEWLAKPEVYRRYPFREQLGFQDLMAHASFDDIWNRDLRAAGVHAVCAEFVGLSYHLGGMSNHEAIARWVSANPHEAQ